MNNLLLHPLNRQQLKQFVAAPVHAVLLSGPLGSGKKYLAKSLGAQLVGLDNPEKLDNYAYFIPITKATDKQEITIDDIRSLIHQLRLKTTGRSMIRRVVIIEDAHLMSLEAQTALLKILEEPPGDTVIILTALGPRSLLPTVVSRAQRFDVLTVSLAQTQKYFQDYPNDHVDKLWQLSGGRVGLITALLANQQNHPLQRALDQVRPFLAADPFERLAFVQALATKREDLNIFLEALARVMRFLHHGALVKNNARLVAKLSANRQLLKMLRAQLAANAQGRLVGLTLALNLKS